MAALKPSKGGNTALTLTWTKVDGAGKVRARSVGSCTIYVMADNGVRARGKARVK